MHLSAKELYDYAISRYGEGYDVCVECYSRADWDNLEGMHAAEALAHMANDVYIWKLQLSETRFE